jgi:hypothetical protein
MLANFLTAGNARAGHVIGLPCKSTILCRTRLQLLLCPINSLAAWARSSVVEHCVDIAGVTSSILVVPTIYLIERWPKGGATKLRLFLNRVRVRKLSVTEAPGWRRSSLMALFLPSPVRRIGQAVPSVVATASMSSVRQRLATARRMDARGVPGLHRRIAMVAAYSMGREVMT